MLAVEVVDLFADVVNASLDGLHPALQLIALTTDSRQLLLLLAQLRLGFLLRGERSSEQHGDAEYRKGAPQMCLRWLHTDVALPRTPMRAPVSTPMTMRRGSKKTRPTSCVSIAR